MTVQDFRPISVTNVLSRVTETIIVDHFLKPSMQSELVLDQFAFRRTGSTTAALAYFMHRVHFMLEHNNYVRCLMVDFSKAFDIVNHQLLKHKLLASNVPAYIVDWIISFLSARSHVTKYKNVTSEMACINTGIVQGSVVRPTLYVYMESDLRIISKSNLIFKFADDTNLLSPEHTDIDICVEFQNIIDWADVNKKETKFVKNKGDCFSKATL
jgi:hypothetical protein